MSSPSASACSSPSPASPVDALFAGAHCQRLLKLRHQDMDKMEIKTKTLCASMNHDMTRFTVYKLQIQSKVRHGSSAGEWLLEKRYSEFFFFRRDTLQFVREWEAELRAAASGSAKASASGGSAKAAAPSAPELALVDAALRAPLAAKFPRKHMRCDTEAIVRQRREGLADFVRKLLAAYADFSVYLHETQASDSPSYARLRALFARLEDFLCVPDAQKEAERRQADAVLALDDVDVDGDGDDAGDHSDDAHTCCICLDDRAHAAHATPASASGGKVVKLPCRHEFHEDCIIDWFNASTTCPLCRRPAFKECPRVFDVTMRELTEL